MRPSEEINIQNIGFKSVCQTNSILLFKRKGRLFFNRMKTRLGTAPTFLGRHSISALAVSLKIRLSGSNLRLRLCAPKPRWAFKTRDGDRGAWQECKSAVFYVPGIFIMDKIG
jgi:hypothetical protein